MKSSLIYRMAFFLFLLLSISFGITAAIWLKSEKQQLMDTVVDNAIHNSNIIKASTRYSMLQNRKEDLYRIIKDIGDPAQGVVGIRYYDKDGTVLFSTDESEIGGWVDMNAEACVVCHRESQPPPRVGDRERTRIFEGPDGERVIGLINPIENEPECYNAACHYHQEDENILGVLDVRMSLTKMDKLLASITTSTWSVVAMITAFTALAGGLFIHHFVYKRINRLVQGTREISKGNLDFKFDDDSGDEIGHLSTSFNQMSEALQDAHDELEDAYQALIEVERMDSLGKLSATVAHKLNNPLAGILTYLKLISKKIRREENISPDSSAGLQDDLDKLIEETTRCGGIVKSLIAFSPTDPVKQESFIPLDVVEKALKTIDYRFEDNDVKQEILELEGGQRTMEGDPGLIRQALQALYTNAFEAMDGKGTLTTVVDNSNPERVVLRITDTGKGIPKEKLNNIFKPFYSTHGGRNSPGLGLAVVYGIVHRHSGNIRVESEVGKGTTFTIRLPRFPGQDMPGKERVLSPVWVPDHEDI